MVREVGQDQSSVEKNKGFFSNNESDAQNVRRLETYQNVRTEIDWAISGRSGSSTSAAGAFSTTTRRS